VQRQSLILGLLIYKDAVEQDSSDFVIPNLSLDHALVQRQSLILGLLRPENAMGGYSVARSILNFSLDYALGGKNNALTPRIQIVLSY